MKANFRKSILALLMASTVAFSCSKSNDTTPADQTAPLLVSSTINDKFETNTKLSFNLNFSDDTELSQAKVVMHSNFDGHSHGGRLEGSALAFEKIYPLTGKTFTLKDEVTIASDALTGNYHFIVTFTDKAGNIGEEFEHEFEITGKTQPTLTVQYPGTGVTLTTKFTASGGVNSTEGLAKVTMTVNPISKTGEPLSAITTKTVTFPDKPTSVGLAALGEITLPANAVKGDYLFIATAVDVKGNTKTQTVKVKI